MLRTLCVCMYAGIPTSRGESESESVSHSVVSSSLQPHGLEPAGSSFHGISQARTLEWVAISFSRRSSRPRVRTSISCTARWILDHWLSPQRNYTSRGEYPPNMLSFLFWHFFRYHQTKVAKFCCKILVLQSPMPLGCHCVKVVWCVDVCPSEQHCCLLALKAREYLSAAPSRPTATCPWRKHKSVLVPRPEGGSLPRSIGCWWHAHAVWIPRPHGRLLLCLSRSVVCRSPVRRPSPRRLWHCKCKINKELCLCLRAKKKIRGQGCFCLICNPMAALSLSCSRAHFSDTSDRWLNQVSWFLSGSF